jgi:hypothetical protein
MRYHPLPRTAVPVVAMAMAAVLIWIGWGSWRYPVAFWAPGDLSRYHADIGFCIQCHEPFHGPSQARCLTCHAEPYFGRRSSPATAVLHRDMVAQRIVCSACHTEHRGALAQITDAARVNPHGEFVFLATGVNSCGACHEFASRVAEPPQLKENPLVKSLRAAGGRAHVAGRMARCLRCHAKGT